MLKTKLVLQRVNLSDRSLCTDCFGTKSLGDSTKYRMTVECLSTPYCEVGFVGAESNSAG